MALFRVRQTLLDEGVRVRVDGPASWFAYAEAALRGARKLGLLAGRDESRITAHCNVWREYWNEPWELWERTEEGTFDVFGHVWVNEEIPRRRGVYTKRRGSYNGTNTTRRNGNA